MATDTVRKYLIATHGSFAKGIKSSLDLIIGSIENVFLIEAYLDGNQSIEDELQNILKTMGTTDELIIFTDLMGGSITNQAVRFALKEHVHVVSGINLPLLIEVLMADPEIPIEQVIEEAIIQAQLQIVYVNRLMNPKKEGDSGDD